MPSSVVARIEYNVGTSALQVHYISGSVYEYINVPAEIYAAMLRATSKGSFLNKIIKKRYLYKKLC